MSSFSRSMETTGTSKMGFSASGLALESSGVFLLVVFAVEFSSEVVVFKKY